MRDQRGWPNGPSQGRRDWIDHVNMPQTQAELDAFRQAMQNGTPFGDEDWKQQVRDCVRNLAASILAGGLARQQLASVLEK